MADNDDTVAPRAGSTPVLLLHLDTDFSDTTGGHSPTQNQTTISTAQPKFGAGSAFMSSASGGSYINVSDNLGDFTFSGDYTIDCWVYPTSYNAGGGLALYDQGNANLKIISDTGGTLYVYGLGGYAITSTDKLTLNAWNHVAVTRAGTSTRLFLNGVQEGSIWSTSATFTPTTSIWIGRQSDTATRAVDGYIDEFRIINGYAAWTANFTPPTSAYPFTPPPVTGTLTATQAAQTLSAAGGPRVGGALTATQAAQTLSAAGRITVSGTLTVTQAAQTLSATGNVTQPIITGALTITQAAQTLVAAGTVQVSGTLSVTQANQTISAAGGITVRGTLTVTQANQTLSAAGAVTLIGTLAITQAAQTLSAAGRVTVSGTLTVNQSAQTLSATGSVLSGIVGGVSITQAAQTLSAHGNVPSVIGGALVVTQAAQTISATGSVLSGLLATLNITQASQTLSATGTVISGITGTLAITQAAQTLSAAGNVQIPGAEPMHTLSAGSLYVAGSIKTAAGPVSALPQPGRPGTRNFVTDATVPLASGVGNIVAGGGSNRVPVYDDGANWRIG